jgi:hypothetical protein
MKVFSVLAGLLLLAGCAGDIRLPDPPDDLIERDSMVIVLRELVVIESVVQTRYQNINTFYKVMSASGKKCLEKYHITPARFERSYDYYVAHGKELQTIYAEVIDSLNREVSELSVSTGKANDTIPVIQQ